MRRPKLYKGVVEPYKKKMRSDSRRRINILGGDTIGHREKNFMWTFLMVTEVQQLSESTNTKALCMLIKKENLITVNFNLMFKQEMCCEDKTNLLQFTISFQKSHRQNQCILQLVCEDRVFFFTKVIFTSLHAGSSVKVRASNSTRASTFLL